MPITSGLHFGFASDTDQPTIELQVTANPNNDSYRIVREVPALLQQEAAANADPLEQAIARFKADSFSGLIDFAKQQFQQMLKGEASPKQPLQDPLNPEVAYAQPSQQDYSANPIPFNHDMEVNSDYFEYRNKHGYGVISKVSENLWRDIHFAYPNREYEDAHFEKEFVGEQVRDWRREDARLHKVRIYFFSTDKSTAEKAAKDANTDEVLSRYLKVDYSSCSRQQKPVFQFPDLELDPRSGELSLPRLYGWYLPLITTEKRPIGYKWDALRIEVKQNNQLIRRLVCWGTNRGRYFIEPSKNHFEPSGGGYFGQLKAGKYQLQLSIYDDVVADYPFEVLEVKCSNPKSNLESYYSLQTPKQQFVHIVGNESELTCQIPLENQAEEFGSADSVHVAIRMLSNGKEWPEWEKDTFLYSNTDHQVEILNKPKWSNTRLQLQMPLDATGGREAAKERGRRHDRLPFPDGRYQLVFDINGTPTKKIDFDIKDCVLQDPKSSCDNFAAADLLYNDSDTGFFYKLENV